MNKETAYRIFSLGDSAISIDFGNLINESINKKIISLFHYLKNQPIGGMIEAVPAYSSLSVYYDPLEIKKKYPLYSAFDSMKKKLEEIVRTGIPDNPEEPTVHIKIPVCYDGDDLEFIASEKRISVEEIIKIHSSATYRVYMLGFLPGFAYMGEVDERIAIQRKQQPASNIAAGSVGIAGKQTGIYPLQSPGGWQIIGRTPMRLFNAEKEPPTLLEAGNTVEFYSITKDEFKDY